MLTIEADYIGGDPDVVSLISAMGFLVEEDGVFTFTQTTVDVTGLMGSSGKKHKGPNITYEVGEVLTVISGDANHMRMLTRLAVGEAIGGSIGGLIGASGGKRNQELALVCQRDGFTFVATFRVAPDDARRFIDTLQSERKARGEGPLPSPEEVIGGGAASDTATSGVGDATLVEIRDLLVEQNLLLSGIAERLDHERVI